MCVICGCGEGETTIQAVGDGLVHDHAHPHVHTHADGTTHSHEHGHAHAHAHAHAHDHGHGHGHGHGHVHGHANERPHDLQVPGRDAQTIALETALLGKNQALAERNRGWLAGRSVLALNQMSSPGAGKTTLLERCIRDLHGQVAIKIGRAHV